ncbi:uncharacterized protein LOC134785420 [Penaeus indicus]|uniref:uncharacterized protein LOC134785420 n=1 Tax=Penaeus indicus TaxID=29960 RepID=UPI00300DA339
MSKPVKSPFPRAKIDLPSSYRSGPTGSQRPGRETFPEGSNSRSRSLQQDPSQYHYNPESVRSNKPKVSRFRRWIYRNPRRFQFIGLGLGLTIFFSRPLYDIFLREHIEGPFVTKMESVKKAQSRLRNYPKLVANCAPVATEYARCVALKGNVLKGDCTQEFDAFKRCILESAKKMKTKI